jgi:hypothetical protein
VKTVSRGRLASLTALGYRSRLFAMDMDSARRTATKHKLYAHAILDSLVLDVLHSAQGYKKTARHAVVVANAMLEVLSKIQQHAHARKGTWGLVAKSSAQLISSEISVLEPANVSFEQVQMVWRLRNAPAILVA